MRNRELAVQMGGAVGSRDPAVAAAVAAELGLAAPTLPWHTIGARPASLAAALGTLAGVLAKVARDVTLLAQDEIGELREGGDPERGGSTAMAHKRNPVAAVSVIACTKRVPGLVATMFACMEQEHERAGGAWQAEWGTLAELLSLTGSATSWAKELLERLEVDRGRMLENLARLAAAGVAESGRARASPRRRVRADRPRARRAPIVTSCLLHHVIYGREDAAALVMGGSLGSTLAMWEPQLPLLAQRTRLIRFDHRGHGGSPAPPEPYAIDELGRRRARADGPARAHSHVLLRPVARGDGRHVAGRQRP